MDTEIDKKPSGKSAFERGADIFSFVIGGVMTVLLAPQLHRFTADAFAGYVSNQFGQGWEPFFRFLWMVGVGLGTFAFCLMLSAATLRLGFAKLTMIFFGR